MSRMHAGGNAGKVALYVLVMLATIAGVAVVGRAPAQSASCGDAIVDPGEGCDPPGTPCSSSSGAFLCNAECQCTCGDGVVGPGETCELPGSACGAFLLPCGLDCTCPVVTTTSTSSSTSTSTSTSTTTTTSTSSSTTTSTSSTTTTTIPDHYVCYQSSDRQQNPPVVTVKDQFQTADFRPKRCRPKAFCAPAKKNGGPVGDSTTHLKRYKVRRVTPGNAPTPTVDVTNQFGTVRVQALKASGLLVPTSKSLTATPPPLDEELSGNQHYLCYKVRVVGSFTPITVTAEDQFGSKTLTLRRPTTLCNPASKNDSVVKDPDRHLLCYDVRGSSNPGTVYLNNQFGAHTANLNREGAFCVPSTKVPATCADAGITPPTDLPDQTQCTENSPANDPNCNGWTTVGPTFTDAEVDQGGPAQLYQKVIMKDGNTTTCWYLYRFKNVATRDGNTANGVLCFSQACDICAWDLKGARPTMFAQLETPASNPALDDCSRCHPAGPLATTSKFWTEVQSTTFPLNRECSGLSGPRWVGAPPSWAQRANPLRNVPPPEFPEKCDGGSCHPRGFVKGASEFCDRANVAFATGGAMDTANRRFMAYQTCKDFADAMGCTTADFNCPTTTTSTSTTTTTMP